MARTTGSPMPRFATKNKTDSATDQEQQQTTRFKCVANGCPATAGIGFGSGNNELICRFHDQQPANTWPEITTRLRNRIEFLKLAEKCARHEELPDNWHEHAKKLAEESGITELEPGTITTISGKKRDEKEFPKLYAQRINAWLQAECAAQKTDKTGKKKKKEETWQEVRKIVGKFQTTTP